MADLPKRLLAAPDYVYLPQTGEYMAMIYQIDARTGERVLTDSYSIPPATYVEIIGKMHRALVGGHLAEHGTADVVEFRSQPHDAT